MTRSRPNQQELLVLHTCGNCQQTNFGDTTPFPDPTTAPYSINEKRLLGIRPTFSLSIPHLEPQLAATLAILSQPDECQNCHNRQNLDKIINPNLHGN